MTRQTLKVPADLTDEQRAEYEEFTRARAPAPDGSLGGPFDAWLLNPEIFRRLRGLGGALWQRTSLDRGLVELAICVTGRIWEANYEWAAHAPRAVEHGVPRSVLEDVLAERRPEGTREHQLIYDVCLALHRDRRLDRTLFDAAVEAFGEQGLAELIAVTGFYTLVSMTLNAFEVQAPAGMEAPFDRLP